MLKVRVWVVSSEGDEWECVRGVYPTLERALAWADHHAGKQLTWKATQFDYTLLEGRHSEIKGVFVVQAQCIELGMPPKKEGAR